MNVNAQRGTALKHAWGMPFKCTSTTTAARIACLCPVVDCDLYCDNRTGAGVLGPADPVGCSTCGGCRELPQKGMDTFFLNIGEHLNFKQKLNCSNKFFILFWNFLTFRKYLHHREFSSFWPRNLDRHFNSYGIAFMYHKVSLNCYVVGGHRGNISSKKIQSQPARNFP